MAEKRQSRAKRRKKSDPPKKCARAALEKQRPGELSDPMSTIGFGGKEGHEFYRPRCIVQRPVEMIGAYREHGPAGTLTDEHGPARTNTGRDRHGQGPRGG